MKRTLLACWVILGVVGCNSSGVSTDPSPGGTPTPTPTPAGSGTPSSSPTPTPNPSVGPNGGKVSNLRFAVTGDTRPPFPDFTFEYPTSIITAIWKDIQAESPRPDFAVATGDYCFADGLLNESKSQYNSYLQAAANFSGPVFYSLGNHDCNSLDGSNCVSSNPVDYTSKNFGNFMSMFLAPLGKSVPYYSVRIDAADGSWTSKFVIVAANAWDSTQAAWLDTALSDPTTYTFVVRHEPADSTQAPGTAPSDAILANHPLTLKLVGHHHRFATTPSLKEVVTGNGGAPLDASTNYGYTIVARNSDGTVTANNYDYQSHAVQGTMKVNPDGSPAP